jgi:putative ABC transport system permease protein
MRRVSRWLYDLCLEAFPRQHRNTYRAEMLDLFEQQLTLRQPRPLHAAAFVAIACGNAIVSGFGERLRHYRFQFFMSRIDIALAWRMLIRYPGLTLIGTFGMAVGIAIAAGAFSIVTTMTNAAMPFPEGGRMVSVVEWDSSTSNHDRRMIYDYASWGALSSIEDLSIARTVQRNVIVDGQVPEIVTIAELSAAAFRVVRTAPLLGRPLLPEDEQPGAPDTVVIGYREWLRRFNADPAIIGKTLQLGSTVHHIVGVMPDGFAFPINHSYWIPWRINAANYAPRTGPSVYVFGRLAPGATMANAQAELATIGDRVADDRPATHEHLRPRVVPYAHAYYDMDDPETALILYAIQLAAVLLLLVVCFNVAILVHARTATRQGEIAVRSALGASRGRIIAQLFVEAILMAAIAGAAGLGLAAIVLRQIKGAILLSGNVLPFWMSVGISSNGVLYTVALTMLAAAVIGVVPALKATGRDVQARLQTLSAGSGSRMQMGRTWSALIVAQVALTVTILPAAVFAGWSAVRFQNIDSGYATREFLTAQLVLDRSPAAGDDDREFADRFARAHRELSRRMQERPEISDVTFALAAPGEERAAVLEVEGQAPPPDPANYNIAEGSKRGHLVRFNRIATNWFDAFGVPLLMGRALMESDRNGDSVVVNRALVDALFGGGNALGARIRYVGRSREASQRDITLNRWYEIVGVVPDFPPVRVLETERPPRIYHAAGLGDMRPARLALRVRSSDPMAFAATLRETGAAVDPSLQLEQVETPAMVIEREQGMLRLIGITVTVATISVIALAVAGVYALMSFTVARRRREIGIRVALGASRRRLLLGMFSRALWQLGLGVVVGMCGAAGLDQILEGEMLQNRGALIVPITAVILIVAGLLAVAGPALRGLRVQPTEALREE